jgi:Ca2+-transporting ATPase
LGALFIYFISPLLFNTNNSSYDIEVFHTSVFTTLVLSQLLHAYNFRFDDRGIFRKGIFANRLLNITILLSILLQAAIIYVPFLQGIFSTTALNLNHWLIIAVSAIIPVIFINIVNEIIYYRQRRLPWRMSK